MTRSLRINDKEYRPSTELAREFNYTSDYISKLARDEKILGTRIGRQWFIEPESLRTYMQQLAVEKRIAKENLSRQRKRERLEQSTRSQQEQVSSSLHGIAVAAGQALAVLVCGLLVGTLSFTAYSNDISTADLAAGLATTGERISSKLLAGLDPVLNFENSRSQAMATPLLSGHSEVLVMEDAGPQFDLAGVYTTFPKRPTTTFATASTTVATLPVSRIVNTQPRFEMVSDLPFSDEVVVREDGMGVNVRPIFKDSVGDFYQLSVTPIGED